jgi:hypothetical protein
LYRFQATKGVLSMAVDRDLCSRRLHEELTLAEEAKTPRRRNLHSRHADDYARELTTRPRDCPPDTVTQWKLRRQSEVFGDWLAEIW